MKKIAFVGCSHLAAFQQECQLDNNWTYQLYKKYPHHQYRNYSQGGKGPDYFKRALVEAKIWGADIVFMNRTHMGRWSILADIYQEGYQSNAPIIEHQEENWTEIDLGLCMYGHSNYKDVPNKSHPRSRENRMHPWLRGKMEPVYEFLIDYHASSELRRNDDLKWYKTAPYLYNFENFFLIDWENVYGNDGEQIITSNICDIPVFPWFKKIYNTHNLDDLIDYGIFVSRENHHLSRQGNTEFLNGYILTIPEILNALESE